MIVYTTDPKDEIDGWTVEVAAARNGQRVGLTIRGPRGGRKTAVFNIPAALKLAEALVEAIDETIMEATEAVDDESAANPR